MATLEKLRLEVASIINSDNVEVDVPLGQLGIDSLNVVELILACQQIYSNVGNYEDFSFDEHSTLRDIDAHMLSCGEPAAS